MNSATSVRTTLVRWVLRIVPPLVLATVAASAPARPGTTTPDAVATATPTRFVRAVPAERLPGAVGSRSQGAEPAMVAIVNAATNELTAGRLEEIAMRSALAPDAPFVESSTSVPSGVARSASATDEVGLPLPQPDGWAAVAATIALALFFFLRRTA